MANRLATMAELAIAPDTVVTLSYVLFDEEGHEVDQAGAAEPLRYVHGYAQIVPGLEKGLEGLHAGDKRKILVEAEDAFGEHDDSGIFEVDRDEFPDASAVSVGDEFVAESPAGESLSMRIVEVLPDAFVVDTNHPLAGQRVRFEVEVTDVRPASPQEILDAVAELGDRAEDAHDACCDHDHDHDHHDENGHAGGPERGEPLVQLSKKH